MSTTLSSTLFIRCIATKPVSSGWVGGGRGPFFHNLASLFFSLSFSLSVCLPAEAKPRAHDIALLELEAPLKLGRALDRICIPAKLLNMADDETKWDPDPMNCWAAGWGATTPTATAPPTILQEVHLPIDACDQLPSPTMVVNETTHLCAGYAMSYSIEGLKNVITLPSPTICKGDSGGPLICPVKANSDIELLYGIATASHCPPYAAGPSVFVRTSYYADWIEDVSADTDQWPTWQNQSLYVNMAIT
jgi:hypothetical protein